MAAETRAERVADAVGAAARVHVVTLALTAAQGGVIYMLSHCQAPCRGALVQQVSRRLRTGSVQSARLRWLSRPRALFTGAPNTDRARFAPTEATGDTPHTLRLTGIVQGKACVVSFEQQPGFATLRAAFPAGSVDGVTLGASVAINGTCLTVTQQPSANELCFDLIVETLRATNLGRLKVGDSVNFERSARVGDEVGGHNVSGHVHTTVIVLRVEDTPNNRKLVFKVPAHLMKYIFPKARRNVLPENHHRAFRLTSPFRRASSR